MHVGVDIGGTFTDLVLAQDGKLIVHKLLSTPINPAEAMLNGLETITPGGLKKLQKVAHGSTVATNAILERNGARVALISSMGFKDVLSIGRQNRPDLYALQPSLPPALIPPERCYEVPERLDYRGDVLVSLDMAALDVVLDEIAQQDVEAVAVCFLYSYVNPEHEQMVRDRILERKLFEDWQVALSSDVLPEFREYERASTVALEAYVRPLMVRYVSNLTKKLPKKSSLRIMKSDGGIMSAAQISQQAVNTALSGPAAGVLGAFHLAQLAGFDQIITLDMGGTSTDVALCPGELPLSANKTIDDLPLRVRVLDIETIGAGGGSIARVDAGGALRVGPQSAGADPGPIVYGRGGKEVTVSDANALLGRLDSEHFLGGRMQLDLDAALSAFSKLSSGMHLEIAQMAQGVIDVANVNIDRAMRRVSVARGYDPRQFTLVAFGGAGPLHACEVAARLQMPRVLVPRYPGVLCALGLLVADVVVESSRAVLARASRGLIARLRAMQAEVIAEGRDALEREGFDEAQMTFNMMLDMRYQGQAHELTVPFGKQVVAAFHQAHEQAYGHAMHDRPVEIVNMRLQALGVAEKPQFQPEPIGDTSLDEAYLGSKPLPYGEHEIAMYDRDKLNPGAQITGEALIFQLDSTTYIPADWRAAVDGYRNLVIEPVDAKVEAITRSQNA
ncbi:hydantoinase/oxoprolinase family protein [Phototrophicus methaneseepsis]|uniref:Hydantoinase/oxoprolinase family protein n=1 Tax=Phototrophicus methaneseepsis TaxID=2710758 RepID=A0A7S8IE98_9CHLR|nr:hydantoinase/oxoprolinase family protein [Phototrophicus methaneseepsis]QPC82214.1 hydantoinase/oxoprolinase family protein [Phototrophicus methaneseepsis]